MGRLLDDGCIRLSKRFVERCPAYAEGQWFSGDKELVSQAQFVKDYYAYVIVDIYSLEYMNIKICKSAERRLDIYRGENRIDKEFFANNARIFEVALPNFS